MFHRAARSSVLLFTISLLSIGSSKGQATAPSISPELAYRIESMLRSEMEFPTAASISFGPRSASEVPGYDRIQAHFSSSLSGDKGDIPLLVSHDGSRVAQFTTYDIAADPGWKLSAEGHPARGGPASAPVVIVSYDDLECPFCARLHAALFPALMDRYRDQVRIVYRSFPLEGHPWAMHAAVRCGLFRS